MNLTRSLLKSNPSRNLVLIILILLLLPTVSTDYFSSLVGKAIIFAIFAISLDLAWGYGGILSLGHSVFFGLGAYAFTITSLNIGTPFGIFLGIVLGVFVPIIIAALVSSFVFFSKTSPFYIGVVTLSLALLAEKMVIRFSSFTGGQNGLSGVPEFPFYGVPLYYFILLIFVLVVVVSSILVKSDMGKIIMGVRENEERMQFLGFSTPLVRTMIFCLSGSLAGFAGILYASFDGFVSPSLVGFTLGTQVIVWVAIGGRGNIVGAVIGALLINILSPYFNEYFPYVWQSILGLFFIITVVFFPKGIYSFIDKSRKSAVKYDVTVKPQEVKILNSKSNILNINNLGVSFGKLSILKDLSLKINTGELQCIIGPNGAGKTTLINAITGRNNPTNGTVVIDSSSIEKERPETIVDKGIARTFQSTNIVGNLTVAENLQLATANGKFQSFYQNTKEIHLSPSTDKLLKLSRLEEKMTLLASELAHGDQQLLELCMAIALEPKVLLLDEPTAGLTGLERKEIGKILIHLAHEDNISILVIEHDIDFVKEIADRVTVLYDGTIAADGTVDQITQSDLVKKVYLGGH
ncbi:ATP-binding cassette domain-containing protein [Aquibacillus koreensis]|uniref:ATP-binding cassette domain-containing protein n=1 Tax=Aquibacillus koreensis TaxID=279446 RepID=A0A9X3WJQ3_9BACI|nr:ATP-binding cassette domain-containing protein [Aquibacillus koreensis]MCT2537152.1 ATP-binding cassette domain-containing protein [Aquibacillus koreensis]MDC3419865.1 ATP-binding cassette domain-containing protein [Aquibacillus koreensis]